MDGTAATEGRAMRNVTKRIKSKSSTRGTFYYLPKFRCLGIKWEKDDKGSLEMEVEDERRRKMNATHLIILVHGIIGSAQDWKYAAEQFLKRYREDVIAHRSECNGSMLTFDGVDVMGERLAEEVISIRRRHPSVQKISFVGHSLGGLVARYAIGRLYERDPMKDLSQENGECTSPGVEDAWPENKFKGKIAGLEPINFITLATPHLGSRAHKQVPVFCGFQTLEKVVARFSWCLGKTGKQLFMTDGNGKPPLLLQMVNDCEDLKFLSALQSFKRRVAYANVRFDYLVGWSTSSLRRKTELPKLKHLSSDEKYPHIVNVETIKAAHPQDEVHLEPKASECKKIDMEEEMIRSLTGMSWERVDVSFSGNIQRILAHSSIQVKIYNMNSDGVDVVQHMVDNFLL